MDAASLLSAACIICALPASSRQLSAHFYEPRGQRICKRGTERPCYKIAYFEEDRRKLNFEEASQACRSDGGELLSIESAAEQKIVESFIQELRATDGDFWIGLQRNQGYQETSGDCPSQYFWLDGSQSAFRNWHWDEPSCGYEVCVVMYHQPSAPPGPSGLYMFQWNDDNCETKNNFICKYTKGTEDSPCLSGSWSCILMEKKNPSCHLLLEGDQTAVSSLHALYKVTECMVNFSGNLPPSTPAKNKSSTGKNSQSTLSAQLRLMSI
uniref:C-type lectin domain-containing protein n=1 Tax=Denticeps clupeoides TaxID=299321 RepID=A0AAY4BXR9_9TELE